MSDTYASGIDRFEFVCAGCGNTLVNPATLPTKCECGCRVRAADWEGYDR